MPRARTSRETVVHVINRLAPGGAEKQLLGSVEHSSFRQEVVELSPRGPSRGRDTLAGLRRALRSLRPGVVVAWLERPQIAVAATAPVGTRLIASVCSMPLRKTTRERWLLRSAYARYNHFFAPTNVVREATREFAAPLPLPNFVVIPLAVDLKAERAATAARTGPLRVGFIGRAHWVKGLDVLLAALERLESSRVSPVLIGDGVPEAVRAFGGRAADYVVVPRVENPWSAAGPLDVLVFPSRSEAAGLVLLEAFARGVPVIATPAGGARELIDDGRALVIPIDDVEALAGAIRAVADDETAACARADKARRYVLRVHCWARVAPAYDALYKTAAGG